MKRFFELLGDECFDALGGRAGKGGDDQRVAVDDAWVFETRHRDEGGNPADQNHEDGENEEVLVTEEQGSEIHRWLSRDTATRWFGTSR